MLFLHPHDAFVREFLADLDHARAFFRLTLPSALLATCDLETLVAEPTSLIDDTLSEQQSDLLFSLTTHDGEPRQLYLLFEHKSYADPGLLIQLLGYLGRLYAKQAMPVPIVPFVFYHGEEPFALPRRFAERFSLSPTQRDLLQRYLPDFGYWLCDLSHWQTPPNQPPLALQVFLEALRSARSGDPLRTRQLLDLAARLYGDRMAPASSMLC